MNISYSSGATKLPKRETKLTSGKTLTSSRPRFISPHPFDWDASANQEAAVQSPPCKHTHTHANTLRYRVTGAARFSPSFSPPSKSLLSSCALVLGSVFPESICSNSGKQTMAGPVLAEHIRTRFPTAGGREPYANVQSRRKEHSCSVATFSLIFLVWFFSLSRVFFLFIGGRLPPACYCLRHVYLFIYLFYTLLTQTWCRGVAG